MVFGWWCIGAGMCTGVVWNFLFWYTEDLATGSQFTWLKTLQGLLIGIQSFLGELPFNFISGSVLKKLGHINVMSLVLLIYAIRRVQCDNPLLHFIYIYNLLSVAPAANSCARPHTRAYAYTIKKYRINPTDLWRTASSPILGYS